MKSALEKADSELDCADSDGDSSADSAKACVQAFSLFIGTV